MYSRIRAFIVTGCTVLAFLGPVAHAGDAQEAPGVIGSYYPTQLIPGQTNVLNVAMGARNPVQSIEITPSSGITIGARHIHPRDRSCRYGAPPKWSK